ncbi:MAG: multicopper oxidase [Terracidiphilus sp.]
MNTTRRKLLIEAARCAAALSASQIGILKASAQQPAPPHYHPMPGMAHPSTPIPVHRPLRVDRLEKFVDPLPIPPLARPIRLHAGAQEPALSLSKGPAFRTWESNYNSLPFYRFTMRQVPTKIHRDVPSTPMWSYGETVPGPTIEARTGHPIHIEWVNALPDKHFLPIDHTLHGAAADQPEVRTAVHVHGAKVPPQYDGFPENWQTPGQTYQAVYPLNQDAATLWYHDHAMGIERLNQYAGLYGFFLIRDETEDKLALPSGKYEIPLAFADRLFSEDGSLYYPDSGDPDAPWIPEIYGDCMMVNGKLTPYLEVEPRPYRFRILNAANSRTFIFSLSNGQHYYQIGTDQGLLAAPAELNQVALSPGERADIIIDFSQARGQQITMNNQSWELMQFRVSDAQSSAPKSLVPSPYVPASLRSIQPIPESASVKTRLMILREYMSREPRRMLMLLNGTRWHEPVTERPELDSVEIWSLANTTSDIHPIHLHLVRFQVLDRQSFNADEYLLSGKLNYVGVPSPPPPGDRGWKDTVQTYPETVTRIIVRFEGYTGRYLWHCHLLEHAANEMMRPFEVVPKSQPAR